MKKLSQHEIEKIIKDFIEKYSNELYDRVYKNEEIVRSEGDKTSKIYIVKEGIFRIGKIENMKKDTTIALCRKFIPIVPISALVPDFPSLYEIRSIENNLANPNSIYEIPIEQWNEIAEKDESLWGLLNAMLYDNLTTLLQLFEKFRLNRNIKNFISDLYDAEHWILNSGIPAEYLASYFLVHKKSIEKMNEKQ